MRRASYDGRIVFALYLILSLLFPMIYSVTVSATKPEPYSRINGPYIDKLVARHIPSEARQVEALTDDEIDLIGEGINPDLVAELQETENINVSTTPQNGYVCLSINTEKYPFNYTGFRRALAFAIDKNALAEDIWGGYASALDSCVPAANPYSVEGKLNFSYYDADIDYGNKLLNETGFLDVNGDGYREAPNGDNLDVVVWSSDYFIKSEPVKNQLEVAFEALHIDALITEGWYYDYLERLYWHGDYDMAILSRQFNTMYVDWLGYNFWSELRDYRGYNLANFENETFDFWADKLLHTPDYDTVYEAAQHLQQIWTYQCPEIVLYQKSVISAYRTDRFDGFVNDVHTGVPSWWTYYRSHPKLANGGPFGGTLRTTYDMEIPSFNFMTLVDDYPVEAMLSVMYDSLLKQGPNGVEMGWMAKSYNMETHDDNPAVPDGFTRVTFELYSNLTWTDGNSITAEDIAFSINYYRDTPGGPYGPDFWNMTQAVEMTTYKVRFQFNTESIWHLGSIGYKPIIPKHIFVEIGLNGWNTWNPNPSENEMVTSGPFNVSTYVPSEMIEFDANDHYFRILQRTSGDSIHPSFLGLSFEELALVAGVLSGLVVTTTGVYWLRKDD